MDIRREHSRSYHYDKHASIGEKSPESPPTSRNLNCQSLSQNPIKLTMDSFDRNCRILNTDNGEAFNTRGHESAPNHQSPSDDKIENLKRAFQDSIEILLNDPLMQCFNGSDDLRQFMLDRVKEIIDDNMHKASEKYSKETLNRINDMERYTKSLQREIQILTEKNQRLSSQMDDVRDQCRQDTRGDIRKMEELIETQKEVIDREMVKKENMTSKLALKESQIKDLIKSIDQKDAQIGGKTKEIEGLRSEVEELSDRIEEFKQRFDLLEIKADKAQEACKQKSAELEGEKQRVIEIQKEARRLNFEKKEQDEEYRRTVGDLIDEVEMYKSSMKEVNNILNKNSKGNGDHKEKIASLDNQVKKFKHECIKKIKTIEEMEFMDSQKNATIEKLREDIIDYSKKLSSERNLRNEVEIRARELNDKVSDLVIEISLMKDNFEKASKEVRDFNFLSFKSF